MSRSISNDRSRRARAIGVDRYVHLVSAPTSNANSRPGSATTRFGFVDHSRSRLFVPLKRPPTAGPAAPSIQSHLIVRGSTHPSASRRSRRRRRPRAARRHGPAPLLLHRASCPHDCPIGSASASAAVYMGPLRIRAAIDSTHVDLGEVRSRRAGGRRRCEASLAGSGRARPRRTVAHRRSLVRCRLPGDGAARRRSRLHPFCPIITGGRLFAAIPRSSPKGHDLRRDPRCVIHAMPGPDDDELCIRATATEVVDDLDTATMVRTAVARSGEGGMIESTSHAPLFEFDVQQVDVATWVNIGQPGTRTRYATRGAIPISIHASARSITGAPSDAGPIQSKSSNMSSCLPRQGPPQRSMKGQLPGSGGRGRRRRHGHGSSVRSPRATLAHARGSLSSAASPVRRAHRLEHRDRPTAEQWGQRRRSLSIRYHS